MCGDEPGGQEMTLEVPGIRKGQMTWLAVEGGEVPRRDLHPEPLHFGRFTVDHIQV